MGSCGVKPTPITLPMENAKRVLVYDRIDANRRNTVLLLGLFAVVALPALAYIALYLTAPVFGAALSVSTGSVALTVILIVMIVLAIVSLAEYVLYRYVSVLVLRSAGAREVTRDQEPELWRRVENLCIGAGLPQPRIHVVESSAANAFSAGLDPHHASLVVTRGLLRLLERHELEGVIAHELSHIGNYDTRLSTTMAVTVRVLRLPFAIVMGFFRFLFGLHWMLGVGALFYGFLILGSMSLVVPLIASESELGSMRWILPLAMALPVYVLFGAPLLGLLIQRAVSKQWEFLADADAVLLTRHAEGLATALAKMATAGGSRMKVGGATAHLYIVDPLGEDAVWWDRIFSTHPLVEERIAALAAMGGGISPSLIREAAEAGAKVAEKGERALGGFRLTTEGTAFYAKPDATSAALGELEGGALITVLRREGEFLRILTAAGSGNVISGYIRRSAVMTEVDLDGPAAA